MFDKNVKIVSVDKEDVRCLASLFKTKALQYTIIALLFVCIVLYLALDSCVIVKKENIIQMEIEQLNEYINEDKAELVYNYIRDNGITRYEELDDINGIGLKTIQKLEKFTYIKGVD